MNLWLALCIAGLWSSFSADTKMLTAGSSARAVPLKQAAVKCACGKVTLSVDSPSALRLVCYCRDCRGYVNALNEKKRMEAGKQVAASTTTTPLDPWGGADWTQIYPGEISVVDGAEHLRTCLIRDKSPIRRVYASCCKTPMFSVGGMSALLNTHLLDETNKPEVKFRIVGRQALAGGGPSEEKPKISWSVPLFAWPATMIPRCKKELMEPMPVDVSNPEILDNFKEG